MILHQILPIYVYTGQLSDNASGFTSICIFCSRMCDNASGPTNIYKYMYWSIKKVISLRNVSKVFFTFQTVNVSLLFSILFLIYMYNIFSYNNIFKRVQNVYNDQVCFIMIEYVHFRDKLKSYFCFFYYYIFVNIGTDLNQNLVCIMTSVEILLFFYIYII